VPPLLALPDQDRPLCFLFLSFFYYHHRGVWLLGPFGGILFTGLGTVFEDISCFPDPRFPPFPPYPTRASELPLLLSCLPHNQIKCVFFSCPSLFPPRRGTFSSFRIPMTAEWAAAPRLPLSPGPLIDLAWKFLTLWKDVPSSTAAYVVDVG